MKTHILTLLAASLVASGLATAEETVTTTHRVDFASYVSIEAVNVTAETDEDGNTTYVSSPVTIYSTTEDSTYSDSSTTVGGEENTSGNITYFTIEDATEGNYLAENEYLWVGSSYNNGASRPVQVATTVTLSLDLETLIEALEAGYVSGNIALLQIDYAFTNTEAEVTGNAETGVGLYLENVTGGYQLSFLVTDSEGNLSAWSPTDSNDQYTPLTLLTVDSEGNYTIADTISTLVDENGCITVTYSQTSTDSEYHESDDESQGTTVTVSLGDSSNSTLYSIGYGSRNNTALDSVTLAVAYTYTTTYTIPEPATATLSLLALAGLAARRRRK